MQRCVHIYSHFHIFGQPESWEEIKPTRQLLMCSNVHMYGICIANLTIASTNIDLDGLWFPTYPTYMYMQELQLASYVM